MSRPSGRARDRPPRFSVVTITRNEAERLPRLVASLAEFLARGGEVLVLDTGSDDGTAEIAASAGCRVFVEPRKFRGRLTEGQARRINQSFCAAGEGPMAAPGEPIFNFGRARAHAAALARHDLQFAVDGSDVVEVLDIDFLDATARAPHPAILHFETRILNPTGWSVEFRDYVYDRRRTEWRGRSHNYLALRSRVAASGRAALGRDRLLVSHHTHFQKARSYHVLAGLDALAEPREPRWEYFMGRELLSAGYFRSALAILLRLDRPGIQAPIRSAALSLAAQCAVSSGGTRDAVETLLFRAVRRDSTRRDPLLRLARRRVADGNMQGAASFAAAALAIPSRVNAPEPEDNHTVGPHAILYWALLWLGRPDEARVHFKVCQEHDPTNPIYRDHARLFERR